MRGFTCPVCKKKINEEDFYTIDVNEKNWPCPDCGKISRRVVARVDNNNYKNYRYLGCLECRPIMKHVTFTDRVCGDCVSNANWDSLHENKKQDKGQKKWQLVLPTAIISLFVGFFLGWLFFKKLQKKRKVK